MYKHSQAVQMHKQFDLVCISILTKKKKHFQQTIFLVELFIHFKI